MAFSGCISIGGTQYQPAAIEIEPIRTRRPCQSCGKELHGRGNFVEVHGRTTHGRYCYECAGFDRKEGFTLWTQWLRQSVPPHVHEFPDYVLADWLDENGRHADAARLRKEMKK